MAEVQVPAGFLGAQSHSSSGGTSGGGDGTAFFSETRLSSASSVESIVAEESVDFDAFGAPGTPLIVALTGIGRNSNLSTPGTGTVRLYVGAAAPGDTTGGTVRCTLTVPGLTEQELAGVGVAFPNPGGQHLVQLTIQSDFATEFTYFRGYQGGLA